MCRVKENSEAPKAPVSACGDPSDSTSRQRHRLEAEAASDPYGTSAAACSIGFLEGHGGALTYPWFLPYREREAGGRRIWRGPIRFRWDWWSCSRRAMPPKVFCSVPASTSAGVSRCRRAHAAPARGRGGGYPQISP